MAASDEHLSRIETMWSIVRQAHNPRTEAFRAAQQALLRRYGGAVKRYALAALRNEEAADEVLQEFALKFVRGDFGGADPERGRFRSFVKTIVYRLIVDHQRGLKRLAKQSPLIGEVADPMERSEVQHDELFRKSWRDELLAKAWNRLEEFQNRSGRPYYAALRCRVAYPELRSPELAEKLSEQLGKSTTAGAARVLLHRSRETFAKLLVEEVSDSLPQVSRDALTEELIDLELYEYCRPYLEGSPPS